MVRIRKHSLFHPCTYKKIDRSIMIKVAGSHNRSRKRRNRKRCSCKCTIMVFIQVMLCIHFPAYFHNRRQQQQHHYLHHYQYHNIARSASENSFFVVSPSRFASSNPLPFLKKTLVGNIFVEPIIRSSCPSLLRSPFAIRGPICENLCGIIF